MSIPSKESVYAYYSGICEGPLQINKYCDPYWNGSAKVHIK